MKNKTHTQLHDFLKFIVHTTGMAAWTLLLTVSCFAAKLTPAVQKYITNANSQNKISVVILYKKTSAPAAPGTIKHKGAPAAYIQSISTKPSPQTIFPASEKNNVVDLWLINGYAAQVSQETLKTISQDEQVQAIFENFTVQTPKVTPLGYTQSNLQPPWGLDKTGAIQSWEAFNVSGLNVRIGHLDTGIDAAHPDLQGKVAAWAEFDAFGNKVQNSVPHDSGFHGTHTAGTLVGGSTSGCPIGVAPNAKLLSALVLNGMQGTLAQVVAGMQWVLDPDENPNTDDGAHILNMSLGAPGQYQIFQTVVDQLLEANVLPIFAIGNNGPGNADAPGNTVGAVSVGATSFSDTITNFSGGGTITWEQEDYTKPEIAAPGYGILSTIPNGRYQSYSGTSMATPHVSGAAALLMESSPGADILAIKNTLLNTSIDIGATGLDERSGHGRLDILAALSSLLNISLVRGTVRNQQGIVPAIIKLKDSSGQIIKTARADAETGQFFLSVPDGAFTLSASFGISKSDHKPLQTQKGTVNEVEFMLSASANKLDNMLVYPNPYKPSRGDQHIYFEGVPEDTKINVYSFSGLLIKELSGTSLGQCTWDARNDYAEPIASGLYFYLASYYDPDNGWQYKKGKMAVIR